MKAIVVAMDKNNAIGFENALPWGHSLKDDLAHFKKTTSGGSIIMGRNTFESFGSKPLPNRENIVVSRKPTGVRGVLSANSLEAAYALARYETYVIGGGQIYAASMDDVDKLIVSEIDGEFPEASVFFPAIDKSKWTETNRDYHKADERNAYAFDIVTYERTNG